MLKVLLLATLISISLPCAVAHTEFVYAGFNHLLVFDTANVTVTAFDYRRHVPHNSFCDALVSPPLVEGAKMQDWLSKAALASSSQSELEYTHLGYEVFIVEVSLRFSYCNCV